MPNLKFINYRVTQMSFKINQEVQGGNFKLTPRIDFKIQQTNEKLAVIASVILAKDKENIIPFELNVEVNANFIIEKFVDINQIRKDAITFIYPYLRSIVSGITANANMAPYFLPFLDLEEAKEAAPVRRTGAPESIIIGPLEDIS